MSINNGDTAGEAKSMFALAIYLDEKEVVRSWSDLDTEKVSWTDLAKEDPEQFIAKAEEKGYRWRGANFSDDPLTETELSDSEKYKSWSDFYSELYGNCGD